MTRRKKRQESRKLDELQVLIKQEIVICQEILSQMSQQEYLMLIGEMEMRDQSQKEANTFIKQLKTLQKDCKKLIKTIMEQNPFTQNLLDFLNPNNETDAEILVLLDTYKTLIQKITDQKKRNHSLYEIIQKEGSLDVPNPTLRSQTVYDRKSKKPLLITIDYSEENSR